LSFMFMSLRKVVLSFLGRYQTLNNGWSWKRKGERDKREWRLREGIRGGERVNKGLAVTE